MPPAATGRWGCDSHSVLRCRCHIHGRRPARVIGSAYPPYVSDFLTRDLMSHGSPRMKVSVRSSLIAGVASAVVAGGVIAVPPVDGPTTASAPRVSSVSVRLVADQANTNVASLNAARGLSRFSEAADRLSTLAAARGISSVSVAMSRLSETAAALSVDAGTARLRVQTVIGNLAAALAIAQPKWMEEFRWAVESASLAVRKLLQQLGLDKFVKSPRTAGISASPGAARATPAAAATRGTPVRGSSASTRRLASAAAAARPARTPVKVNPLVSAASLASRHSPSAKAAAASTKPAATRQSARAAAHRADRLALAQPKG